MVYKNDTGSFPVDEKSLWPSLVRHRPAAVYLQKWHNRVDGHGRLCDYWGSPLRYVYPGRHNPGLFDIHSWGLNRHEDHGQWDDISNWINRDSR